ncbi:MAG: FHA domain-containing protein [Myxococcaceae bacterium]|jgi:hypothetical protein|nr:FHA domain-containing protein [Myxococcaceae bacterium]
MALRLSFAFGPRRGVTLDASRRLIVGRGAHCDVHLLDEKVSREHCVFEGGEALAVTDLSSRNGTWVNGVRLDAPRALREGDAVGIGETLVLVSEDTQALRAADGASTLVLARGPLGLQTSAATATEDTLGQAGRLVLEAALSVSPDGAARALTMAFAKGLRCDEVVLCSRTAEGALRPRAAFLQGASVSLNAALVELSLSQQRAEPSPTWWRRSSGSRWCWR